MKSKYDLIKHFAELGFRTGAEIGVAEGHFSEAMLKVIPDLHLYCVDAWTVYKGNRWAGSEERNEHHRKTTIERLKPYPNATIVDMFSMDAIHNTGDFPLDFVYIDGNHSFDYVMQDLIEWSKRVRKGGIISGDDYYSFKGAGVVDAVNAYTKAHRIEFNLTDPLTDKIQDRGSQEQPSFWWIKQ